MKKNKILKTFLISVSLPAIIGLSPQLVSCSCSNLKNATQTNFGSTHAWTYDNINNKTVTAEYLYKDQDEKFVHNCSFSQAAMLKQCIDYKTKHPNKDVWASVCSYHFSYFAGACVDYTKGDYGKMKKMYDTDYDNDGYYKLLYLIVLAARAGIKVVAIAQYPAYAEQELDETQTFDYYLKNHMNDLCDDGIHTVSDFLTYEKCEWGGETEQQATDLFHPKISAVSNYIDSRGIEHDGGVWLSSQNFDTIYDDGSNGHGGAQTGIVISDHLALAKTVFNYCSLVPLYCGREDSARFRTLVSSITKNQIDNYSDVPENERIVYLGNEKDNIFELYFSPFAGTPIVWDTMYNPYCKYIDELCSADADKPIELTWDNPNFVNDNEFANLMLQKIDYAFAKNGNKNNKLILGFTLDNYSTFDNLVPKKNIKIKSLGEVNAIKSLHSKDLTISYYKNGEHHYVTILNSNNFQKGALYYQSNHLIVIKENDSIHNSAYYLYTKTLSVEINKPKIV